MIHKTLPFLAFLILVPLAAGCGDSLAVQAQSHCMKVEQPITRIAVVDFAGDGGQAIADMLTMHLMKAGYEVVERQYLSDLFRGAITPTKAGQTDESPTDRLSRIGKLINADAIITGDLVQLKYPQYQRKSQDKLQYEGAICQLSVRAFDVRTREVFWTAVVNVTASAKNAEQLGIMDFIDEACNELVVSFCNPKYVSGTKVYHGNEIAVRRAAMKAAHAPAPG